MLLITPGTRRSPILIGARSTTAVDRISARAIDTLLTVAIFFIASKFWGPLGSIAAACYAGFQDGFGSGQSIGKKIIGLRVIEDGSGLPCSPIHSLLRNAPVALALVLSGIPGLWFIALLVAVPLFCLELYLVIYLETGVRMGDLMSNTWVVEHFDNLPNKFPN